MPEIGMFGKLAWYFLGIIRHSELLSLKRPPSAYRAERRFAKLFCNWVGFYPFRGPDASLTRQPSYQEPRSGAPLTQTGTTHGNQKHLCTIDHKPDWLPWVKYARGCRP